MSASVTDFLLELRSEEIPARMQVKAKDDLARLFADALAKAGLAAESVETFATPRRLALIARGLPLATDAVSEETKGPKVGAPPQAMDGFLRKVGLSQEQLVERDGVYFAVTERAGRKTADVLAEAIPAIIRAFPWPKSQRWGAASVTTESLRWVRPLQGIVALFDGEVVPCAIDGIVSGRETMGHRFHSSGPVTITSAATWADELRERHVLVHFSERCRIIRDGAAAAASAAGLSVIEDEGLVVENAGLTEWPVPLLGRFDAAFLSVPSEVIQLTARVNQKYFVCVDGDGKLANAFVCTANIDAHDGGAAIIAGNEKVLAARLSDAKFFWEQDLKVPLAEQAAKLSQITFHEKLGTVADKVERVAKLARWLVEEGIVGNSPLPAGEGPGVGDPTTQAPNTHPQPLPSREGARLADLAERAARLCKADLVTGMVGEFPELQGIMGGYYARAQGEPDAVADAIRDHYKPVGQGDDVPTAPVTVAVSLADKLDTLVGFFAIGEPPSGSRDPFALRRAALGVVQVIASSQLRLSFTKLLVGHVVRLFWTEYWRLQRIEVGFRIAKSGGSEALEKTALLGTTFELPLEREPVPTDFSGLRLFHEMLDEQSKGLPFAPAFNRKLDEFLARAIEGAQMLVSFLTDRLKVQQREAGVRHDLIDAVFALGGEDDLVRLLARVKALQSFVETGDGANLLAGYKRAANLLKQAESSSPSTGDGEGDRPQGGGGAASVAGGSAVPAPPSVAGATATSPSPVDGEDKDLLTALDTAEPLAAAAVAEERFEDAMRALATLRAPIDAFFDGVMVNDPDPEVRAFRLGLLARFRDACHAVADFSKIEG